MLRIFDTSAGNETRREVLRIGLSAFGGLTLSGMQASRALALGRADIIRDKAVVFLNLQGGPTQFETFDPKMAAPREIRSITGEVKTSLPGVTFGGTLPMLARLANRMAIVRSYRHGISSHGAAAKHVMAGGNATKAAMSVLYSRVAGLTNEESGMPLSTIVMPGAVGKDYSNLYKNPDRVTQTGTLSPIFKPFDPSAGGEDVENMKLRVDGERFQDRRYLLSKLDELRRAKENSVTFKSAGRFREQAFDILLRGTSRAFDFSDEPPAVIERYDTGCFEPSDAVKKRNSYAKQFSPVALGRQMLMARRLCEAGCRFVTVTCGGWDMHGGGKEFTMTDGIGSLTPAIDKAVSAFIEDVEQRGLSEKILLVITGEFGRTPKINKNGGRDHWGNLCTLAFVGGGLRMGQVIGSSDRTAGAPASDPISSSQVLATVMHTLFDLQKIRILSGLPNEVSTAVSGGEPIRELV